MAVLSTQNYLVSSTQVISGPIGTTVTGTALTQNSFTPLATFPFPVEILGCSIYRGVSGAIVSGAGYTCGYAPVGTSVVGGVVACSAAASDVAAIGAITMVINDNGVTDTTKTNVAKPIIVPVGNSIGVLASDHAQTNCRFSGYTIQYRPCL